MTEHRTDDDVIAGGLRAWMDGDLDALEAILDPHVSLRWVRPGPWDCHDRDQVIQLLRARQTERGGRPPYPVHIDRIDDHTLIVVSDAPIDPDGPLPFPVATRVTIAGGKIVAMQQYRTDTPAA
jgi:ketosteroid isomerase-like protein